MERCPTCKTPLDAAGKCVTCAAKDEGLSLLTRNGYDRARELMDLLGESGFSPSMERVPPADEHEKRLPQWNLYVPAEEATLAAQALGSDWKSLIDDEAALEAARRGLEGVDLDAGGEIACPACGHRFVVAPGLLECPDCGLGLGGE
jgi:hypothetical protein